MAMMPVMVARESVTAEQGIFDDFSFTTCFFFIALYTSQPLLNAISIIPLGCV